MVKSFAADRRAFGGMMAGLGAAALLGVPRARAAAPDGAGAVNDMVAAHIIS